MPIPTSKLVYDFKRKFNAINSGKDNEIDLVDIIAYLNEAQEIWFENRCIVSETNQKVRNDLRPVKRVGYCGSCEEIDGRTCRFDYPDNLYKRLNQIVTAVNDCCKDEKYIIPRIPSADFSNEARLNPYRQADFYYEQLICQDDSKGLVFFHDGKMEVISVCIDYYFRPPELHAPSLEECDGPNYYNYNGVSISKDTNLIFDKTYAANDIVDVAVLLASRDVGDVQGFQSKLNEILKTEGFFK